jgi:hypothetical protein
MKKYSPFLAIKEIQIKTMLRFHLTPVRMATIKNTSNNKCWWGYKDKGSFIHCWLECKLVKSLWNIIWRLLKKLKIELPYDPEIPLLRIYLKECKSGYTKDTWMPMLQQYSQKPSYGHSQDAPPLMNGLRKCDSYIQWNFI